VGIFQHPSEYLIAKQIWNTIFKLIEACPSNESIGKHLEKWNYALLS